MFKMFSSFFCLFFLSFSVLFAAGQSVPNRSDFLDSNSPGAKIKLERAEKVLSTLVFDPQNYHLILSNRTSFGGEAVSPNIFSDKPTMIIYQGALSPDRSNEELAFMMAHELGHLNLYHNEKMGMQMEKIFTGPPAGFSGAPLSIYFQKTQEQEADMFGLYLYKQAGYDIGFFPYTLHLLNINPNIHYGTTQIFRKELSSLSMQDPHYSMKERFALLVHESQFPVPNGQV